MNNGGNPESRRKNFGEAVEEITGENLRWIPGRNLEKAPEKKNIAVKIPIKTPEEIPFMFPRRIL